jgi:hypothetical protein
MSGFVPILVSGLSGVAITLGGHRFHHRVEKLDWTDWNQALDKPWAVAPDRR